MRRRLVFVLVALLVASACSSDDDPDPVDDASPDDSVEAGDDYVATIRRTEHNVPHIAAGDLGSLGFGYGYAFAEDHLCSLADAVLQANSEAAAFHGDDYIAADVVYAALDVKGDARAEFDAQDDELKDVIRGYAAGYNRYLEETGVDNLPGYCVGEEWVRLIDEYDLAAYYKVLSLRASVDPLIGFIASARPPGDGAGDDESGAASNAGGDLEVAWSSVVPDTGELGSNGWAIGPERTEDGTTMLVGNPHFPWQGALRFYEVHLTVPGTIDVYGASLLGSPAVNIGFTDDVAWTHTVSAGNRFTAYTLDLADGDPTSYAYGDEVRQLEAVDVSIEVADGDGTRTHDQTVWFSHYGPVIDFPGVGWSEERVLTFRDANADNDEIIPQFFAMNTATSMDDFIDAHAEIGGIPWVNTIAASADGRIWYADASAAPNLSDEAVAAWEQKVANDVFTSIALDNGVILLDGSDPLFEWVDEPGARDPGLVPFADQPQLEREDFVFNANDPYWLANPAELLVKNSPVFGLAEQPQSPRTRMNAVQLGTENGDSGSDGLFSIAELQASALSNRVFTAEILGDAVVDRCRLADLGKACDVLDDWDRRVDLDSRGAVLWREFIDSFDNPAFADAGELFAVPFDPADPVGTPRGLAAAPAGGPDPIVEALRSAIDVVENEFGLPLDVSLGDVQRTVRGDRTVAIHGGSGREGVTNVVGGGGSGTTSEPGPDIPDDVAYPIANGTSFIYVLEFTPAGPVANSILTYGNTGDPQSPFFADQTELFSSKKWKPVHFEEEGVAEHVVTEIEISAPR